ncbi:bifunctional acetate--CoA ligase family protein/GNAT family N-acetyltransferase [Acidihalobacter ferrooxydans]|uniref:GNAT family N-acetyltransferase n=1 Tax=Acidihalobacter ferrooxydans TaxID=1765967 RepID=A0A1P8UD24_9GAMM|nr:bifunctional acetate--CoA ligase family protein/GNAT family N-acetyltransferase [Acidihalobacter ferrooxydans]APZ41767.1 GNAT family N-acetyltransferase [Acidihalobacter ferrooxydans]
MHSARHSLETFFAASSIAIIGASERPGAVGTRLLQNLIEAGYKGKLYPVNPKYTALGGLRCYVSVTQIEARIDLALIATPAATVPDVLRSCAGQDIGAAIIISAGFGEAGDKGRRLQETLLDTARRYGIRLLGPNCLGLIRPHLGLNATFSKNQAAVGDLALISQSGALCTAIMDWAEPNNVGFSAVVSLGDAADLDFGDILDYLALDARTRSILLYVEGIKDARRFISALRAAARMKPVIVIKSGRNPAASRAACSHTGALAGADEVFDAALERAGVVRACTIEQWFAAAQIVASTQHLRGDRRAIVGNAGGPGVLATDRAADLHLTLAQLSPDTLTRLGAALPERWQPANPVDILGDAGPERYAQALDLILRDPGVDAALVILTPQGMTDPEGCATAVVDADRHGKPVLACWMGQKQVTSSRERFAAAHIPYFNTPEAAIDAFAALVRYTHNQRMLMQAPGSLSEQAEPDIEGARMIIEGALSEGRRQLSGLESKALLNAFRIPTMPAAFARDANEALVVAESLGLPVAMKIASRTLTHKSDIGGVRLNIRSAVGVRTTFREIIDAVRQKYPDEAIDGVTVERMADTHNARELMVGVARDPVFGPTIRFGAGGGQADILEDHAIALPPLNPHLIDAMIARTRVARLLDEFRELPAIDHGALEHALLRVSEMVCELPEIQEMDINPLIATEHGVVAVDARFVVAPDAAGPNPYAHMAIHPYPTHLTQRWQLADGTELLIRPIRPEDAVAEQDFVLGLSEESKYFRFRQTLNALTPEMLVRFTQIDYDREMAFIAVTGHAGHEIEIGVTRYIINPDGESCEFALVVADAWQGKGIGTRLMEQLMRTAHARGLRRIEGEVLSRNRPMLKLMRHLGFSVRVDPEDPEIHLVTRSLGSS